MSIPRAIGQFIDDKTGVSSFCDESAHRWKTAPRVEVATISEDQRARGPGRTVEWVGGVPKFYIKRLQTTSEIEIKVSCKTETDGSSEAKCVILAEQIKEELNDALYGLDPMDFIDPVTSQSIGLIRFAVAKTDGAELDDTHELHVHTAKFRMQVETRQKVRSAVPLIIERADNHHPEAAI